MKPWAVSGLLFAPAVVWGVVAAVGLARASTDPAAWAPVDRRFGEVAGSEDCRRCHPSQYETWHRTYHRTMTQRVDDPNAAILAPFGGEQLEYGGFVATMGRSASGTPHVEIRRLDDDGVVLDVDVEFTVGSHRYQQYVARIDRGGGALERYRLPVAWHPDEQRWIHLNAAFLEPEAELGDEVGYLRHLSRWNDNCLFCHNTEPVPGLEDGGRFDTSMGEVGIACEACHGPGRAHVRRHADPFRRLLASASGDGSITHPDRLPADRSAEVCGRCHGQRIGKNITSILASGDGFVPGHALQEVSRPILADASVEGLGPRPFAARFWPDQTPRLSAYEYQALLASPCHEDGNGLTCNDCHDMHGAPPDRQVAVGREGAGSCIDCHAPAELSGRAVPGGHGGHGVAAPDVDCLDCHMPRITYGLIQGMRTHRISSPKPTVWLGRDDQPDACTQCHVDRTRAWAATAMADLGFVGGGGVAPAEHEGWAPRVALDLVGGDPLQRALAADALAYERAAGDPWVRAAWLVEALDDAYPAVRWIAWRGLERLLAKLDDTGLSAKVAEFDPLGPPEARIEVTADLRAGVETKVMADPRGASMPTPRAVGEARLEPLRHRSDGLAIWIGE